LGKKLAKLTASMDQLSTMFVNWSTKSVLLLIFWKLCFCYLLLFKTFTLLTLSVIVVIFCKETCEWIFVDWSLVLIILIWINMFFILINRVCTLCTMVVFLTSNFYGDFIFFMHCMLLLLDNNCFF
jgi:hypothetical protein